MDSINGNAWSWIKFTQKHIFHVLLHVNQIISYNSRLLFFTFSNPLARILDRFCFLVAACSAPSIKHVSHKLFIYIILTFCILNIFYFILYIYQCGVGEWVKGKGNKAEKREKAFTLNHVNVMLMSTINQITTEQQSEPTKAKLN